VAKVADFLKVGATSTLLIDGWNWWVDEMRELVPPGLARMLASDPDWLVLDVSENSLIVGQVVARNYQRIESIDVLEAGLPARPSLISAALRKPGMSADRLAVALAPNQVLIRRLDLPLTAPRNLHALVRHELERCQPLPTDQIYFDCRIVSRDTSKHRMGVELAIVKKTPVDRAVAMLAGWGIVPRIVGLRDQGGWPVNFFRDSRKHRRMRISPSGLLLILAVALSGFAVKAEFDRHDAYAEKLQAAAAVAKAAANDVEAKHGQANEIADRLKFISGVLRNGPPGPWLEAVTHALPDGTWVVDVERHGQSVRLRGYSKDASALIGLLDASPSLSNARFTAPLTPGGSPGTERFDLTLDLRLGEPS